VLVSAVNVSASEPSVVDALARECGGALLDVSSDAFHNRSVFTLAGPEHDEALERLARACVERLDLTEHHGVHPRLGVLDVVPFTPRRPVDQPPLADAIAARDAFARFCASELALPCFLYGPDRSLPEIRRRAFVDLVPDIGPASPHPTAGACCVGARPALIAFNLVLDSDDIAGARAIAQAIRSPELRALGFAVGSEVQVSCNLIRPAQLSPGDCYDLVAEHAAIRRCELIGLVPEDVYKATSADRRALLDLEPERTIEARLRALGVAPG
jgi:glutamate formiminotransferase / 5-formyltetrahydrofolate cyclo-ligase